MSGPSAGRAVPGWALQAGTGKGRGEGVPRHKPATRLSEEGASQVMVTGQTGGTRPASHLGQLAASSTPRGGLCGQGHDKTPRDYMAASAGFFPRSASRAPQAQGLRAWALPPPRVPPPPASPTLVAVDGQGELRPVPWNPCKGRSLTLWGQGPNSAPPRWPLLRSTGWA